MTRGNPILARTEIPAGGGERVATVFYVEGGLNYLSGNSSPYFSLTFTRHRKGFPEQCYSGGAGHDEILKRFPRFADLAALHLSDIDGAPMHAVENGYYHLAAALGGLGERFHGGNSPRHFPKAVIDPARPYATTDYRNPTPAESLQTFADHMRVSLDEARSIAEDCMRGGAEREKVKARLAGHVDALRPRWKEQAEACITKHQLVIFGDVAAWEERQRETKTA